jgi:hypothetical protein
MKEKYAKQVKKFTGESDDENDDDEPKKSNKSPEGLLGNSKDEL